MPPNATVSVVDTPGGDRSIRLAGRLDAAGTAEVWTRAIAAARSARSRVRVDASAVEYADVAGAALLVEIRRSAARGPAAIDGLAREVGAVLAQFDERMLATLSGQATRRGKLGPLHAIGAFASRAGANAVRQLAFLGEVSIALAHAVRHPGSVRWRDMLTACERVGVDALPIVALIAFLMGVILAFQSAIPLRQYGGEVFVADLVGLSMLRELGPLMTAILLAGRTGASFAAELGTMKVNDEINALSTMGLDPVRFLVVPRIAAAFVMTPILTIFADLVGLAGGALTMLAFAIPFTTYFGELEQFVHMRDFFTGWVKSFVFGTLIAAIGCMKGLDTRNDATAVGESTTDAVVASIIMIVVVDGLFAYVYYKLDL